MSSRSQTSFSPAVNAVLLSLFALATLITGVATYLSVADSGNAATAGSRILMWVLIGNLILILALGGVLVSPLVRLLKENQTESGSARLRLRIIALFSLAAMIPTVIVAGFLGVLISRSVDTWFTDRIKGAVESASQVAEASQRVLIDTLLHDLGEAAADLNTPDFVEGYNVDPSTYRLSLSTMAQLRRLPLLIVLDGSRTTIFEVQADGAPAFTEPSDQNWQAARSGTPAVSVNEDLVVSALLRLNAYDDMYLFAAREGPAAVGEQLRATSDALTAFREADARKNEMRAVFILSYLEAAMLMLLGTAWLGMSAARRITTPIGELAAAAREVRDGNLAVRLERPHKHDEIDELTQAFNQMTMRLSRQNKDLEQSRIEAWNRSAFIGTVLEGVEAGVVRVDSSFQITVANASAARLLRANFDDLVDHSLFDVAPDFVPVLRKALDSLNNESGHFKRTSSDGHQFDLYARMSPEENGDGCVITFHDTTSLAAGERQAAWRDVARRIAHEIKNPLTPIQLSAERLRRRFGDQIENDTDTFERCINTILRQVADIGRMVDEFSSFARMPKPTMSVFDLCELARNIVFARKMASPNVNVSVDSCDQSIRVSGDDRLLGQAITNVVKNACEAVERRIHAGDSKSGVVTLRLRKDETHATISILDSGPGFPKEGRESLLEPYVTTRESGVGLGLAIVNRIVEDHGGHLTLGDNLETDQGARVDIVLPLVTSPGKALAQMAHEGAE